MSGRKPHKMLSMLIVLTLILGLLAPIAEVVGEEGTEDESLTSDSPTLQADEDTRVIDEKEYINGTDTRKEDNNITIESGGHLILNNSTLRLLMDKGGQYNITVRDGGKLSLWNSTIKTMYDDSDLLRPFLKTDVTVKNGSKLSLREGSSFTFPGFVNIDGSELEMIDSAFEALDNVPDYDYLWDEGELENEAIDDNDDGPRLMVENGSEVYMEGSEINDYYTFDEDESMWEMTWYPLDDTGEPYG
ncbi:MAG: hypothetical protein ACOC8Y_00295, partial [Candidatus Natronoplasma sp.]